MPIASVQREQFSPRPLGPAGVDLRPPGSETHFWTRVVRTQIWLVDRAEATEAKGRNGPDQIFTTRTIFCPSPRSVRSGSTFLVGWPLDRLDPPRGPADRTRRSIATVHHRMRNFALLPSCSVEPHSVQNRARVAHRRRRNPLWLDPWSMKAIFASSAKPDQRCARTTFSSPSGPVGHRRGSLGQRVERGRPGPKWTDPDRVGRPTRKIVPRGARSTPWSSDPRRWPTEVIARRKFCAQRASTKMTHFQPAARSTPHAVPNRARVVHHRRRDPRRPDPWSTEVIFASSAK